MPHLRPRALVPAIVATTLATPLAAQVERHTLQGPDVAVYNLAGTVRVEPVAGPAVTVEITRGGADAARLRIATGELRGRQTLRVIYPDGVISYRNGWGTSELWVREDGTFGGHERGQREGRRVRISSREDGVEAHADMRIGVPRGQKIAVCLGVGRATVTNVEGNLLVDVASATVTAEKTRGALVLDTGSGDITATDVEGDVNLDTGSGNVTVTRMRGPALRIDTGSGEVTAVDVTTDILEIDTGSGNVDARGVTAPIVHLDTGSGNVVLALLADAERVDIDTGSGNVTFTVPAAFGAQVEVETGSGDIELAFPIQATRLERDHFVGSIGDGKGSVTIDTGSGGVRLLRS